MCYLNTLEQHEAALIDLTEREYWWFVYQYLARYMK